MGSRRRYEDIVIGDKSVFSKTMTEADLFAFCGMAGDFNPIHVDEEFAKHTRWQSRILHGLLVSGLITRTLSDLGGEGSVHVSQEVCFKSPVRIGDTITVVSEVVEKIEDKRRLVIHTIWTNQEGVTVQTGKGELLVPRDREERSTE